MWPTGRRVYAKRGMPLGLGIALALSLALTPGCKRGQPKDAPLEEGIVLVELSDAQAAELGAWASGVYGGTESEAPAILSEGQGSAYVALRAKGKLVAEVWGSDGNLASSLSEALTKARSMVEAESGTPDTIEIDLAHAFQSVKEPNKKNLFRYASGKRTGIRGIELSYGDHYERVPPTKMLAEADDFTAVSKRFFKQAGVDHEGFVAGGGQARVFEVQQFLVSLEGGVGTKLLRGNVYVEPSAVTRDNTQATVDLLIDWMLEHLHEDGRMTYMWFPSQSIEKPRDNNMIRQWMATNALIKVAHTRNDPALWERIAKNIDYNLEHFYKQEGELGLIEHSGRVKLGALSLAAMAIINHPQRARWKQQEDGLRRTVASLWTEEGMFRCFYKPKGRGGRNGNVQNFYPGETLLMWAQLYRESHDPELLRRYAKSFEYYEKWHLDPSDSKRRRPSFTPWHTQADFILWETLRADASAAKPAPVAPLEPAGEGESPAEAPEAPAAPETLEDPGLTPEGWAIGTIPEVPVTVSQEAIVDFVFEMNDWLVEEMEVWEESAFDDEKGRFYSREVNYGTPHASATGVYIEGLIDAYEIAKVLGDTQRKQRYALALSRGIRSVMQLQYVDEIDMYYVTDREQTKGGLRTTVMRNEVRVDNVQHVLMGVLKVLERFSPEEFKTD